MNKLFTIARSFVTKRGLSIAAIAAAVITIPATLYAWGPDNRTTFTMQNPATYVTFNSITDNPVHGDERNFVQIRNFTDNGKFGEHVALEAGKEYEVYVFYHNDASTNYNDAEHNYAGIAKDVNMWTEMNQTVNAGAKLRVTGFVNASNAKPVTVWDEAYGDNNTADTLALKYINGSAKITNNGKINGQTLPDTITTTGVKLGYDAFDGVVPGCAQYSGFVTYRFKTVTPDKPDFTVQKQVRLAGTGTYGESVTAKPGDNVEFRIEYKNTGNIDQNDVIVRDKLPAGLTYVANSTKLANSVTGGQYKDQTINTVTEQGMGIGAYAPQGNAFVKFTAKVADASALVCGMNTLVNTASVDTENGSKSDTAEVKVEKTCEQPKEITVCRLSDKKYPVTIKESEFDSTKYSKNPEDCKETPTPETKTIEVCRLSDKKYPVTIKESEFDSTKHSMNASDCETPAQPTQPTELPQTGPAEALASVAGAGSLVAATSYYVASRRSRL